MQTMIALKKLNGVLPFTEYTVYRDEKGKFAPSQENLARTATLQANLMGLGYIMDEALQEHFMCADRDEQNQFAEELISTARMVRGDDVDYNPMYPNFPQQVIDASDIELFVNAIVHYWTFGQWMPEYEKEERPFAFENVNFTTLTLVTEEQFADVFRKLVGSNESLSAEDQAYVQWFLTNYEGELPGNVKIPFKENLCLVASLAVERGVPLGLFVTNATDVLRIATHLSGGDISLAENTKFKSFPRRIRRALTLALEQVISEEDINRHAGKWVRLFHALHVGDYSKSVYAVAQKVRNNEKIKTFNSNVEAFIADKNWMAAARYLTKRPGEFARRLDNILRNVDSIRQGEVVDMFLSVADKVNTRVLLQVLGHFQHRDEPMPSRVIFPKGQVQRAQVIDGLVPLNMSVVKRLVAGIVNTLEDGFRGLDPMGSVYVDPDLKGCPIPTQQRSASEGLVSVARGTHLPIRGDANTLRLFIYWKGHDIDLSATFYDADLVNKGHVAYTRLRDKKANTYHSGDITYAPKGACEFIDVDIDSALNAGYRYVAMNVLVYSGPTFEKHEVCYAGWMTREYPNSNEIFDPQTVEQKIDLRSNTKNVIPVLFDLKTRKAIWIDVSTGRSRTHHWGNNVESNAAEIEQVVEAFITNRNKVSLYDLLSIHGMARGTLVNSPEDADVVFTANDIPFDVNTINADYVV